jgi:hypothetical protein
MTTDRQTDRQTDRSVNTMYNPSSMQTDIQHMGGSERDGGMEPLLKDGDGKTKFKPKIEALIYCN